MTAQFIKTPNGDDLAILPRDDYEDLVDASAGRRAREAFEAGRDELLTSDDLTALLAAPTPLAFWREKRGISSADLARSLDIDTVALVEIESGRCGAPLPTYRRASELLGVSLDDLAAD